MSLESNPLWLYEMKKRRLVARRVVYEVANEGANSQRNQVPRQVQAAANEQVLVNPPAMTNGELREAFLKMAQSIKSRSIHYDTRQKRGSSSRVPTHYY